MADSWGPKQSQARRLHTSQESLRVASVQGRVKQAAPIPFRTDREMRSFNMHIGDTPPEDLYRGRAWLDTSGSP